jgi:hypothetical protein
MIKQVNSAFLHLKSPLFPVSPPVFPRENPHGFQAFERLARTAPGGGAVSAVSQVVEAARCARWNGGMEVSWGYPLITQVMTMTEY